MCWDLISGGVCSFWPSSVWEISGSRLKLLVLLQDHPSSQLLSAFPNLTTGISSFCALAGCKYLHLTLSAACWAFRRAVMLGPFLCVFHSLSNSVRPWDLPLSWIPLCACLWTFFSSGSFPFPSLKFFQKGTIIGQRCDCGMATPSLTWYSVFMLEVGSVSSLSLLTGISFMVPPFDSWESLTSQVSGTFWRVPPISYLLILPIYILSAGLQDFRPFPSPNTQVPLYAPFPPSRSTFTPRSLPHSPLVIAFFSLSSGTEVSSLGHFSFFTFLSSMDCILGILYSFCLFVCLFLFLFLFFFYLLISEYIPCKS
jgi:hypothetical protein